MKNSEHTPIQTRENLIPKTAAWAGGAISAITIGLLYGATHTAEGSNIVMSTELLGKTIGADMSEVMVGAAALVISAISASKVSDIISEQSNQ